jgi:hypothetical protein
MSFTASRRELIDEVAAAAARAAAQELLLAIPQVLEDALQAVRPGPDGEARQGNTQLLELLEGMASAQVSAAGTYAATLKSELAAARKNGRRADRS